MWLYVNNTWNAMICCNMYTILHEHGDIKHNESKDKNLSYVFHYKYFSCNISLYLSSTDYYLHRICKEKCHTFY